jgi:hypothetical protein
MPRPICIVAPRQVLALADTSLSPLRARVTARRKVREWAHCINNISKVKHFTRRYEPEAAISYCFALYASYDQTLIHFNRIKEAYSLILLHT